MPSILSAAQRTSNGLRAKIRRCFARCSAKFYRATSRRSIAVGLTLASSSRRALRRSNRTGASWEGVGAPQRLPATKSRVPYFLAGLDFQNRGVPHGPQSKSIWRFAVHRPSGCENSHRKREISGLVFRPPMAPCGEIDPAWLTMGPTPVSGSSNAGLGVSTSGSDESSIRSDNAALKASACKIIW